MACIAFAAIALLGAKELRAEDSKPPVPQSAYEILVSKATSIGERNSTTGWAYIISGGIALGGSIPAYYLSKEIFSQAVFSIGQTLGVAAIGYGSYLVLIDDEYTSYLKLLRSAPRLSFEQKEALSRQFLIAASERSRNIRRIRVITHGLTAGLNFLNAFTSSQKDLKTALLFVGGINTLAAVAIGFGRSDEEKLIDGLERKKTGLTPDLSPGVSPQGLVLALEWRW